MIKTELFDATLAAQPAELVAITSKQQLPEDLAAFTVEKFAPIWAQIAEWKAKAEELVVTDISQKDEMKMAGEARKAVKKVRTSANALREELKADSLRYGRAVQELYNEIEARLKPIEEHLERQEKFKELYELKQREALRIEREAMIEPLRQYAFTGINFGDITQDDFDAILNNAKLAKQAAEDAAKKAEEDRLERERVEDEERKQREEKEAAEREALRQENERLKAEAEEKERARQAELDRIEQEQRKANIEAAKERKEAEAKAAEERKERERLQKELDDKKAAEEKAEAERLAAIEAELSKGDKAKFNDLLSRLESIKTDFAFKSKKYKTLHASVSELVEKTITYANQKL
jgi:hypothetical protein